MADTKPPPALLYSMQSAGGVSQLQSFTLGPRTCCLTFWVPLSPNRQSAKSRTPLEARCSTQSRALNTTAIRSSPRHSPGSAVPSHRLNVLLCAALLQENWTQNLLLNTTLRYLRHPQRVMCRRSLCQDLLLPLRFSPVVFTSRWAAPVLAGCPHHAALSGPG